MKRLILSLTLGLLVFFVSYQILDEEPPEESRVLSTSESNQNETEEAVSGETTPPDSSQDTIESTPIEKNYEPATIVKPDNQPGVHPVRLEIPSIGVDAPIGEQGYTEDGGMAVPNSVTEVGWFEPGTKPGKRGNSVIAGHVDGRNGPAVFFDLKELSPGDEIYVYGEDGSKLTFTVDRLESYPYNDSPIREIFGPTNNRSLNLITCTGLYDQENQLYTERLTVYTSLTDSNYASSEEAV
ncbi:class F sortase [Halobacillus fulvus]|nr:class F sortase [Halobacillus fulvus]